MTWLLLLPVHGGEDRRDVVAAQSGYSSLRQVRANLGLSFGVRPRGAASPGQRASRPDPLELSAGAGTVRAMEFQDVVRRRRMVREFTCDPVPQHSIDRILANAVRGPSAGFSQGQAFLVLTADDLPRFWAVGGEAAPRAALRW